MLYQSLDGGIVRNAQGMEVLTSRIEALEPESVLVIPGGRETRALVGNERFLNGISELVQNAGYVLSICTGSALLAKAGVLDGLKATSNKKAFEWAKSNSNQVTWVYHARWVNDGKFYTSSGVSAGMIWRLALSEICMAWKRQRKLRRTLNTCGTKTVRQTLLQC